MFEAATVARMRASAEASIVSTLTPLKRRLPANVVAVGQQE